MAATITTAMATTGLDSWLQQATRCLAKDSTAQVQSEIREHYELARESAMNGGASADEADRLAVAALGDATTANRQYRNVLLTSGEARMLRQGNWEAQAICSRSWIKWVLLIAAAAAVFSGNEFLLRGSIMLAWKLFAGGIVIGLLFAAPFLPVYTRLGGRVFRGVRWVAMLTMLGLAFGPDAPKWSWLLISCLWMVARPEWTRASIRRKLPVAEWPRHLYL